jgi:hypothetical protein
MAPGDLVAVFGANLLDDPAQRPGYEALADTGERRPFECVGEPAEIHAAFTLLADQAAWRDAAVVAALTPQARRATAGTDVSALFAPSRDHDVPAPYFEAISRLMSAPAVRAAR